MQSLPVFLRLTGRPAILVGKGEEAEAKRRLLERAGAVVVGEDRDALIAIVACSDRNEAEAAAVRLRARGILLNVVDRPDLCDFTMPAIVDRAPVLIAIGTGGASAGLAKAVRQRIERLLPAGLGKLATALHSARAAMRDRWPDAGDRRAALDRALAEGGALDPLVTHEEDAAARWLGAPDVAGSARTETIVLSSLDPDDLTLRAARLLGEADRILHDRHVPAAILGRARADAARHPWQDGDPVPDTAGLTVILKITAM